MSEGEVAMNSVPVKGASKASNPAFAAPEAWTIDSPLGAKGEPLSPLKA